MKILIIICVIIAIWSVWGYFASRAEPAVYTVLEKKDGYEIREYAAHIVAQTTITGTYDSSMDSGFRIIAGYIFGGNTKKEKLAMTTPVITETSKALQMSEKIAMTVPVATSITENTRTMSFVMPSGYTLDNLPTPNDSRVKLIEVPVQKKAALRFSWFRTESRIERNKLKLTSLLERDEVASLATPEFAAYNGPGTPPWMNRHEILIQIK